MQSKSTSFLRKILPSPLSNNSGDVDPIGGSTDAAMSLIETSLLVLKEASVLASKVPYIRPIAGIVLEALKMRNEVKQLKGEWDVVMQKLAEVGNILVDVGEWYQANDMKEDDLPSDLRNVLKSLQTDLDGIQDVLEQCAKVKKIRKVLLRTDILGKVKKYDARLTHVLRVFQARVLLGSRLAQIVRDCKVNSLGEPAASSGADSDHLSESLATMPSVPQTFFGRDAELAQIIDMIFTNVGPRPARIAILGPGGYGKTTLAHAVLTHPRVQEHYGDARYIVTCESLLSSGALLIELAKSLGVFKAGSALWSHIRSLLMAKECIICFDNFESPWDQPGDTKASVEDLLARITELSRVTVIITMRGMERPAKTQWTRPTMAPLRTLTFDAAKVTWEHIADHYDDFAEKLINIVDCVPLAVNLLAHLAQATSPALLWQEWNEKCTQLIQRGHTDRLSNLESSIQLSIDSERMRCNAFAKDLLGILSLIPDGIHVQQLERFKGIFVNIDILSSLRVLQQCSLINLTGEQYPTHPIIRLFCNTHGLLSLEYQTCLQDFYVTLGSYDPFGADPKDYSEMVLEVNNTKAILSRLLNSNYSAQPKLIHAVHQFTRFCISIGDHSEELISQAVTFLEQNQGSKTLLIQCLTSWGKLYYCLNDLPNAMAKLQEAEKLCLSLNNEGPSYRNILLALGDVYEKKDVLGQAEEMIKKALTFYQNDETQDEKGLRVALSKLGNIYFKQSRLDEAETLYQQALQFYEASNAGRAYIGLGNIYVYQNKLDKAEAAFEKALEANTASNSLHNQGAAYSGLGDVYFKLDQLESAEMSYKMALELQIKTNSVKSQGNCHDKLGDVYFKQDKLNDAEAFFQKALQCFKDANAVSGEKGASKKLDMVHKMLDESKDEGAN